MVLSLALLHKTGLESVCFFVDRISPVELVTGVPGVPEALERLRAATWGLISATCQSRV